MTVSTIFGKSFIFHSLNFMLSKNDYIIAVIFLTIVYKPIKKLLRSLYVDIDKLLPFFLPLFF